MNTISGPRRADLRSTLLIASPALSQGKFLTLTERPLMMPNAFGGVDVIDVVAWECKTKEEIPGVMKELKEEFEAMEETPNLKNSIAFLTRMLEEIAAGTYEHRVPEPLLHIVQRDLGNDLNATNLMYLSGVTRIEA